MARLVRPHLPGAVLAVVRILESTGRPCHVTGECLADLRCGRSRRHFTLATTAPPNEIAGLFDRAVPTAPGGASWQVPTPAGPVDVLPWSADDPIEQRLARWGLTVWAIAWSPVRDEVIDPFSGSADLEAGRLRAAGPAALRLAERPCLALDVARLCAQHGDAPDEALEDALRQCGPTTMARCPAAVRGRLLRAIVTAPHVAEGVALLARTGLASALGAGSRRDVTALLAEAPPDPAVRLAIWLRGARPSRFLRRQRIPAELSERVVALLAAHPVERCFSPHRRTSLARLARLDEPDREALFWMRTHELDAAPDAPGARTARAALGALESALAEHRAREAAAHRTPPLAIDGRDVMEALGLDPGPQVGEALAFLREQIAAAPERNEPRTLRALLLTWVRGRGSEPPPGEGTSD